MNPKAAIFDLDGVVTNTADIHADAWKSTFDKFLKEYFGEENFVPFDKDKDYLQYVDGKPRYDGVRDFLESRGVKLPEKSKKQNFSIKSVGDEKNKNFVEIIEGNKPEIFKTTINLIKKLKKRGFKVAVISSSKNCKLVLEKCNLDEIFDLIVGGKKSEKENIKGKPSPNIFRFAAKQMEAFPGETLVFEDSLAGVKAGKEGNFGMVVGIKRGSYELKISDKSVKDLKYLRMEEIDEWFKTGINEDSWKIKYFEKDNKKEVLRESLCTVGNGYMGVRGCFETQRNSENHYPGFYVAGIYNEIKKKVRGKNAVNNSIVNLPNWLLIEIDIGNSKKINPFEQQILDYKKELDMKKASLIHKIVFKDKRGRISELNSQRFASMYNKNVASLRFSFKPINYSENIKIRSLVDSTVKNDNVVRYRGLGSNHLDTISKEANNNRFSLLVKTKTSDYKIAITGKHVSNLQRKSVKERGFVGEEFEIRGHKGKEYSFEKIVSVMTSRETGSPKEESERVISKAKNFDSLFREHRKSWEKYWDKADIYIERDRFTQRTLRFKSYHLITTYSHNSTEIDVGIPARGIHGEGYRGHIFWDEIYTLPFYVHNFPEVAKAQLMYRYNRLAEAKENAKSLGYKGAVYPWQSADTGKEETQTIHYNPKGDSWGPDYSMNQRHISIAIFYNIYKYVTHTNDWDFIKKYGLEVMVEIARFWSDKARHERKKDKYHIEGVMGPDEFHEKYPGKRNPGFKDNAYTNVMVAWLMKTLVEMIRSVPSDLLSYLKLSDKEIERWKDMSEKMNVIVKNGVIMQFDGFDDLKEIDWKKYIEKHGDVRRMDRILKAEGKSPDEYKVLKQADTLLIFYLLNLDETVHLLRKLGVKINDSKNFLKKNYNYYLSRTSHGSSLSKFVHNSIYMKFNKGGSDSWDLFVDSLESEIKHGLTKDSHEGIHCGLMAGTINLARKYFAGIKTHSRGISIKPSFPQHWKKLLTNITHLSKNHKVNYSLDDKGLTVEHWTKNKKTQTKYNDDIIEFL